MRKLMTTAGLAVVLLAGPAFAASDTQTSTTGADPARTGSAATEGSATGGGSDAASPSSDTSASSGTTSDSQPSTTGADPARTGSAATEGSATGGGSAESSASGGTSASDSAESQTGTMGADPARTGSAATEGSATGGGSADVGTTTSGAGAATTARTFTTGELHGLIGQDVQNAGGEEIGEVKDVVMVDGRPMLVVGVGGFLGLGAKEVTVPYEEATMSSDGIQVSMTEDQLKQQPEYSADATAGVSIKDTYKQ